MDQNSNWDNIYDAETETLNLTQRDLRTLPSDISERFGTCAQHVHLNGNRLSDLGWVCHFEVVKELNLDDNRLCEFHLRNLSQPMENITVLMLNKNEFGDLRETIAHISRLFPNLEHLSLHGNPICPDGLGLRPFSEYVGYDNAFYRSYVQKALPNLKFLDHSSTNETDFPCIESRRNMPYFWKNPTLAWKKLREQLKSIYRNILKKNRKWYN